MAGSGSIDVHKGNLKYAEIKVEVPAPPDGAFTVSWAADGRTANVAGRCPACGAWTSTDFTPVIGGTKGVGRTSRAAPELRSLLTLYCDCGYMHADRPGDAIDKGCGRFWQVTLADSERRPPLPGTAAS